MRTNDKRRARKTRKSRPPGGMYNKYHKLTKTLRKALDMVATGASFREAISRVWKEYKEADESDGDDNYTSTSSFTKERSAKQIVVLTEEEETAVEEYLLWQFDRGMPLARTQVKAIIREIHQRALNRGEKRQAINSQVGPSKKYIKGFYSRHPKLSYRTGETVDRGRINMANKNTITHYFEMLRKTLVETGIAEVDDNNEIVKEYGERIYLADETGWGAEKKSKKVVGRKGAKHAYVRKPSDESHKTLMLGVCRNGEVLKPLIILQKSFPMLDEDEADLLPPEMLFSKTENGSMEKGLFVDWLKHSVIPHKMRINPDTISFLIIDNHGSRFSTNAIDLCVKNKIEVLCYPGHLTHILQGPDVVLNKPLKTNVDAMIQNNMFLTGNSMINRLNFINIIDNAMRKTCTKELVLKLFSATGVLPFDPNKINLEQFPSSLAHATPVPESPVQATCSTCQKNNVELHPLVKQGCTPKKLADVFAYSISPGKSRSRVKTVECARIITSEEIRQEVKETEERQR